MATKRKSTNPLKIGQLNLKSNPEAKTDFKQKCTASEASRKGEAVYGPLGPDGVFDKIERVKSVEIESVLK